MALSSGVNDTDEEESNNSIVHEPFHKPSSENLSMDVSESECNIVNETLSQSDSSDVPTNVITEFNYDEDLEHSMIVKGASYLTYSSAVGIYRSIGCYVSTCIHSIRNIVRSTNRIL